MLPLKELNPILILILISLFIGFITEFTSNVGIANITLPVIAQMVRINSAAVCNFTLVATLLNGISILYSA